MVIGGSLTASNAGASTLSGRALKVAPGVALCAVVTLGAITLQALEKRTLGHVWLESLVLAIILGTVLRTVWSPGAYWVPGVSFSAKTLLEIAVVLLGASVSASAILAIGPWLLIGIGLVVATALASSYAIGRLLGLSPRMATLVACGNSICGNSAIAAVAPVIGANGDEVAASIAFTAVLGVLVVLSLPLFGSAMHMSELQYGALAGLSVYAVPQVLAAATPLGAVAVQFGTLVKLVRVLMLGPVCFALSLISARHRANTPQQERCVSVDEGVGRGRFSPMRLVPWFIFGFLVMTAARSLGWVPAPVLAQIAALTTVLTIIAMSALGLSTDIKLVARSGPRVSASVLLSLVVLIAISFGFIALLRLH